ncbi:histidine phosphatase family protein [Bacillus sp. NEB1478]|uniref:histidine phosphatase family protein n=1 Tax=Bacillus sp. NEB1478 TaxID=3073816 RepID=UPI002873F063|nr:histidine phosphatase family protein [Bacillus sp. NEB1478]WNB91375.1 histidine phosphatase family protein [Bacillus sp. NEB1478]
MKIIVVRHCKAEGQERNAALTAEGKVQAEELVSFLEKYQFDAVYSSCFLRAIDSIKPFADSKKYKIHLDERLTERILSNEDDPNWKTNLKRTYIEEHLKFPGGESTFEAKERIHSFIGDLESHSYNCVLVVTHGNLMSLMINLFQSSFGFDEWQLLSNPDVYLIETSKRTVSKVWGL